MGFAFHRRAADAAIAMPPRARRGGGASWPAAPTTRHPDQPQAAGAAAPDRLGGSASSTHRRDRRRLRDRRHGDTRRAVVRHPGFQKQFPSRLPRRSAVIGGRQVRNIATVGGNIVNAPHRQPIWCRAADARRHGRLRGPAGTRTLPPRSFWSSAAAPTPADEILTAIRFESRRRPVRQPSCGRPAQYGDLDGLRCRPSGTGREGAQGRHRRGRRVPGVAAAEVLVERRRTAFAEAGRPCRRRRRRSTMCARRRAIASCWSRRWSNGALAAAAPRGWGPHDAPGA